MITRKTEVSMPMTMWSVSLVFSRGELWRSCSPWFFWFQHRHRCEGVAGWQLRRTICFFTGEHLNFDRIISSCNQFIVFKGASLGAHLCLLQHLGRLPVEFKWTLKFLVQSNWGVYNCIWSRFAILVAGFASRSSSHQEDWQAAKVSSWFLDFLIPIQSNINLNV